MVPYRNKSEKESLLRKGEIPIFQKKNLSAECLKMNLCKLCDLSFSRICPKYNKNDIKGRAKGCASFYRIIFVFGRCPAAWQHVNSIVTSVTPVAGSRRASHSDKSRRGRAPSEPSTSYLSPRSLAPPVAVLEEVNESRCQSLGRVFQDRRHGARSCISLRAASPAVSQGVGCI